MTDLTLGGAAWQSVGDDTDGQAAWAVTMPGARQLVQFLRRRTKQIAVDDEALD
jgi:hypothetical protein